MIKEFRKPDLNAPRCRPAAHQIIKNKFLKEFVTKYPQYKDLTLEQVRLIINTFHGKLWNHALYNRDGVELPERLGFVFIGTCEAAKKYNTDFGQSIKDEVRYRHRNFESDNYLAKIFYTNFSTKYKFKHREMWMFKANREFKRSVAAVYREKWKMYVHVENGRNISKYVKDKKKTEYFKTLSENLIIDESYDEFDINY